MALGRLFSSYSERGSPGFRAVRRLLIAVAPRVEHRLWARKLSSCD